MEPEQSEGKGRGRETSRTVIAVVRSKEEKWVEWRWEGDVGAGVVKLRGLADGLGVGRRRERSQEGFLGFGQPGRQCRSLMWTKQGRVGVQWGRPTPLSRARGCEMSGTPR